MFVGQELKGAQNMDTAFKCWGTGADKTAKIGYYLQMLAGQNRKRMQNVGIIGVGAKESANHRHYL